MSLETPPEPYQHPVITPSNVEQANRDHVHWLLESYPLHIIDLKRLHIEKYQERSANWAKEEFLGDLHIHHYVIVKASLIRTHNVLVRYHGLEMLILKDAAPTKAKTDGRGERLHYYDWMGF